MTASTSYRLAFATSSAIPTIHSDDVGLASALRQLGVETTACIWNDPAVDWNSYDAVLMRTTWDYFKLYPDFLLWLDRLDKLSVPTINNSRLLRWNTDKRYLPELAKQGVEIIPTQIVSHRELAGALEAARGSEVVVKPTVSGAAWHTVRGRAGNDDFGAKVAALPTSLTYMLQPFMPEIMSEGEWSLIFFEGWYSHAVIKRPAAGDYRVQSDWGGKSACAEADAAMRAAAERVLTGAAAIGHIDHSYARIDGVMSGGRFMLMELEMSEPSLHFDACPEAAQLFARDLASRLRDLSPRVQRKIAGVTV